MITLQDFSRSSHYVADQTWCFCRHSYNKLRLGARLCYYAGDVFILLQRMLGACDRACLKCEKFV